MTRCSNVPLCAAMCLAVAVFAHGRAEAAELTLCIKIATTYIDAYAEQDYWDSSSTTYREFHGGSVRIDKSSGTPQLLYDGYLAQGSNQNCRTITNAPSGTNQYKIKVRSKGRINTNIIQVFANAASGSPREYEVLIWATSVPNGSGGVTTVNIDPAIDEFDIAMAALFAVRNDFGGITGTTTTFRRDSGSDNTCSGYTFPVISVSVPGSCVTSANSTSADVTISYIHANMKFAIIHELGHVIARYFGAQSCLLGSSYSHNDAAKCPSITGHSTESQELQRAAAAEGWAHFYAADTWNDHNQSDCFFEYYGTPATYTINCESSQSGFPLKYNFTNCSVPHSEVGVPLDWLRTFWDVHTDGSGFQALADIGEWLSLATGCDNKNAFEKIDDASNNAAVSPTVEANWDAAKCLNGVNDPGTGGC